LTELTSQLVTFDRTPQSCHLTSHSLDLGTATVCANAAMTDASTVLNGIYTNHPESSLSPADSLVMLFHHFEDTIREHPDQAAVVLDMSLRYGPPLQTALNITHTPTDHARKLVGAVLMLFLKHLLSSVGYAAHVATFPRKPAFKLEALGNVIHSRIPSPRWEKFLQYWIRNKDTLRGMIPVVIYILMKTHIFPANPIECSLEAAALILKTPIPCLISNQKRFNTFYLAGGVIQAKLPSKFSSMLYMSYMSN
jgi:hypothetical protein